MAVEGSIPGRLRSSALVWIDALGYALVVAVVVTAGSILLGVSTGGGLIRAKVLLFFVGFLLMGYATVRLWPTSPRDLEEATGAVTGQSVAADPDQTRFQRFVRTLPPLRWLGIPSPEDRISTPGKLFLGSLLVLLISFLMEALFGVA